MRVVRIEATAGPDDPQASAWRQAASFGGPAVPFSAAFTIGSRVFVGTGSGPATESMREVRRMGR